MKTMTDDKKIIPWVKSLKGVVEVYANMTHLTWSLDDVRVRLGQIVESPDTPNPGPTLKPVSEERAAVTFTWRGAKFFRNQLTSIIDSYEKTNGEIKLDVALAPIPTELKE
jgi:hypothetical protein